MFLSAINVSEGRNRRVIETLAESASRHCAVWDIHSDPDHHRSVITIAGDSTSLLNAIEAFAVQVVASIDLRFHQGVHPRLGALDVVPLVPLKGSTLEDAALLARDCAARIWDTAGIPCFLFGHSAQIPLLPDIRRRAFQDIDADFGKGPHQTAGASAVGARELLVAFNMNLDTNHLPVARKVASRLRAELRQVQTLGFPLASQNRVQVSCNLLNHLETSIPKVFDKTAELAAAYGAKICESEVVGVISRDALEDRSPSSVLMTLDPKLVETIFPLT